MNNVDSLRAELLECNKRNEQAEVVLSNLLHLRSVEHDKFTIPYDDIVVTIQAAIDLLKHV